MAIGGAALLLVLSWSFSRAGWSGPLTAVVLLSLVLGIASLVMGARPNWKLISDGWEVRASWKRASRPERQQVRRAVRAREPVPERLLPAALQFAHHRVHSNAGVGWTVAGFAALQTFNATRTWVLALYLLFLLLGACGVAVAGRWQRDYEALVQNHATRVAS